MPKYIINEAGVAIKADAILTCVCTGNWDGTVHYVMGYLGLGEEEGYVLTPERKTEEEAEADYDVVLAFLVNEKGWSLLDYRQGRSLVSKAMELAGLSVGNLLERQVKSNGQ